uniref:Uncharacterized protein n=1 Tax=Lactuca sativa TaxID=4236 RepID=A0A9R1VFK0_LACSA|nr:hypothetical protein LSAT_V11C500251470 [Lactuca sativa]
MLCITRMSLPICRECISLFLLICWRRVISVAWLIGWSLILEYTLGGAAVACGISTNMLSAFLTRPTILGIVVDPCAAVLVFIITGLLCTGIKESSLAQGIITTINVVALLFIIVVGGYIGFKTQWVDTKFQAANGVLAGSATVFFSYDGFDAVTSTAEERDVSAVVIVLVPCSQLDPDTPIAFAFASYGMNGAV